MSQHQETSSIFSDIHASLHQLITALRQLVRKKKRNQKTRQQYKRRKAQAQAQRVTIQEVEHLYGQEVDLVRISVEKASKHEAFVKSGVKSVAWNGISTVATSWHAVISCVGMTSFGMIMVQNEVICMRRMGVG